MVEGTLRPWRMHSEGLAAWLLLVEAAGELGRAYGITRRCASATPGGDVYPSSPRLVPGRGAAYDHYGYYYDSDFGALIRQQLGNMQRFLQTLPWRQLMTAGDPAS